MSTAADALKAYLEAEKTEYVDVPELGAEGKPLRLFYTPFSGLDMANLQRKHDDFPSTKIEAMFDLWIFLILRSVAWCCLAAGKWGQRCWKGG